MTYVMPENKIHILSTRPVDSSQVTAARAKGITLDILSFIETEPIQTIETQQEIEWASVQEATVVFTSMNAVEAVTTVLDGHIPTWDIYCMGYTTQKLVTDYFGEHAIVGTADNALELADEIIENDDPEEIIFFCGNQRREELPAKLRKHQVDVNEIIVYETHPLHHVIDKVYDAVLFFSPSAVESFFTKNKLPDHTIVFAIGNTTSETARSHCSNKIIVSQTAGEGRIGWAGDRLFFVRRES